MSPTLLLTVCFAAVMLPVVATARAEDYIAEHQYDARVHADDAAVNVRITSNRWPDCTTLESTIQSIFRIEGVADKSDQAKALALWKWFRILVSGTGGGYAYEDVGGKWQIVKDPHKILTVYGHHQCDGQSWAMVPLWRAAGYMAFDQCHHGHTIASLRYRDADGRMRYHDLDPQGRFYWWDSKAKRIGTWRMPLATGTVERHVMTPLKVHSLRTSMRVGEGFLLSWQNGGFIVPSGRPMRAINERYARYYEQDSGKGKGIHAVAGEKHQWLTAEPGSSGTFAAQLAEGSVNAACSPYVEGKASIHPKDSGREAVFVYRLPGPYVAADATVHAELIKSRAEDLCRLELSVDGEPWRTIFEEKRVGSEKVDIRLGLAEKKAGKPSVYSGYDVRVRLVCKTDGDVRGVGCGLLALSVRRMLNKRTLPNLMPGENVFRVTADRLPPGRELALELTYRRDGRHRSVVQHITRVPHYFRIDEPGWELRKITNYDQDFNNETVRMVGMEMSVQLPLVRPSASLPAAEAEAKFAKAYPHPNVQPGPREVKAHETDVIQTNGFFPQSRERREPDERMTELLATFRKSMADAAGRSVAGWRAAQELGCYPAALDELLAALPKANIDMTMFLCKALAQIGDTKAVEPLLAKWKRLAPRGAPGTRYIPDVLAVIGDERVVPALVAPLKECRFDYRFHVAHALGELGGELAEKTLEDLAARDPFRAVREEAKAALAKLRGAR